MKEENNVTTGVFELIVFIFIYLVIKLHKYLERNVRIRKITVTFVNIFIAKNFQI